MLGTWIQPQHLESDALQAYQHAFTSHPARMVTLKRILRDVVAERLSRFLAVEAEFQPVYGLFSQNDYVTEEAWRAAAEHDRFFRFRKLAGVNREHGLSPNLLTFLKFRAAVCEPNFRVFFEELSGLRLGSNNFNVHAMRRGEFLLLHNDKLDDRRLAFVFYLSPNWDPSFGGALHIVDRGKEIATVEAQHNSLAVFDVTAGTDHFIAPIEPEAGERDRMTISGWFYRAEQEVGR